MRSSPRPRRWHAPRSPPGWSTCSRARACGPRCVALLGESTATVAAALPAADALGLLAAVDPALAGEPGARAQRLARLDDLRGRLGILATPWRGRLAAIAVGADAAAVGRMTERLRLDRRSATVVGAAATAPARLGPRLAAAATPADVAEPLDRLPIEAALVVAADAGPGAAARRALPRPPARHPARDRRLGAAR